jgi:hypothetical protein
VITQLVPFDTSIAQAPSVAGKIAVPATLSPIGTMLDVALSTVCAWMFLKYSVLLGYDAAEGSVTTCAAPRLKMKNCPREMVAGDPVNVVGAIIASASLVLMLVNVPSAV